MRSIDPLYLILPHYCPPQDPSIPISSIEDAADTAVTVPTAADLLHFGRYWPKIEPLVEQGVLEPMIALRRQEILVQTKAWSSFIEEQKKGELAPLYAEIEMLLTIGTIKSHPQGGGGVYFLCDVFGAPRFVIKPEDESILSLNNPKHRGSPFHDPQYRVRDDIPLYHCASTEAIVYDLAVHFGSTQIVPPTVMCIVNSPIFYDLLNHLEDREREHFLSACGPANPEKLCSIQAYIPDSIDLTHALHEWFEAGLEQTSLLPIDQEDFEYVNFLLWLTYDADGHSSNFRLFFKGIDETGQAYYGLKKIDNGLCFPEKNSYFLNYLGYLPNAKKTLSAPLRATIGTLDKDFLDALLTKYDLAYAKNALWDRVEVLKELSMRPEISIEEMNYRIELLGLPEGKELALSPMSLEELSSTIFTSQDSLQCSQAKASSKRTKPAEIIPTQECIHLGTILKPDRHINTTHILPQIKKTTARMGTRILFECSLGKTYFHDVLLGNILTSRGIFIPPLEREQFNGKLFVKAEDPLFLRAFQEVFQSTASFTEQKEPLQSDQSAAIHTN
ncbi:MAG: hypothetical protein KGZ39_01405 [Simkania sp.]|nr:hypothetical protein [Simkania sp.]